MALMKPGFPIIPQRWVLYAMLLFGFLLVGCGQVDASPVEDPSENLTEVPRPSPTSRTPHPTPSPTLTPTPQVTIDVSTEALRGLEVEFWHFYPEEQVAPLVRAFNADNPWGVRVQPRRFGESNLLSQAVIDETPAGILTGYPDQLLTWQGQRKLIDLEPYVNDPEWGLSRSDRDDFHPVFWGQDFHGDQRLGIPARRTARFLLYNRTWARELGYNIAPIATAQFMTQACAANTAMKQDADPRNDAFGGWRADADPATMLGWLAAFGAEVLTNDRSAYQFNTPQATEALEYLKDLIDRNCAYTSTTPYPDEELAARQGLFATGSLVDLPFVEQAFRDAENNDDWTVLAFPTRDGKPVLPVYGTSLAVSSGTPEQQLAAWLFIRWMVSPEAQAFWTRLSGDFPVRTAGRALLDDYVQQHPRWGHVYNLLPNAITEPHLESWGAVQWALFDAGTQVFRSYFTGDRIEATLEELERTAVELHALATRP
jgi:multiple sugar transport system substrate-binding protein